MKKQIILLSLFLVLTIRSINGQSDSTTIPQKQKNLFLTGIALPARSPQNGFYVQGGLLGIFKASPLALKNSNAYLFGLYSQKKQFRISIGGDFFFFNDRLYIYNWTYASYNPDEYFFSNINSDEQTSELATSNILHTESEVLLKITPHIFTGIAFDIEKNKLVDVDSTFQFPKNYFNYRLYGFGGKIRFDSQDQVLWPSSGILADAKAEIFSINDSISHISPMFNLDFRIFRKLGNKSDNTLSAQIQAKYTTNNMVFSYLPNAKGRAYHPNQFREKGALNIIVDFQIKAWRFIYPSVFVEEALLTNNNYGWLGSFGGGLRFKLSKQKRVFVRLEYAIGRYNSSNFHLSFNNPF